MNNRKVIVKRNHKTLTANKPTQASETKRLRSNGWGRYDFPRCDKVPAGAYFSEVKRASFVETRSNTEAIEVLYEMKNGITSWQIANGILPSDAENKSYYIKQIYPNGTSYYEDFIDSMSEGLGFYDGEDFTLKDVIGITEYVKISYNSYNSDLGGIEERCPMSWKEFIKLNSKKKAVATYEDEYEETSITKSEDDWEDAYESMRENLPAPEIDDDDEFDDFLPDDDDWAD